MKILKLVLPLVLLAVAALIGWILLVSREKPESRVAEDPRPLVRIETVRLQDLQLTVESQGTVSPRTVSEVVPEVAGRVTEVSPSFVPGGFFEAGDLLLRIDPDDYRQALVQAEAAVAQTQTRLALELAEADSARHEWSEIGDGEAPALTLREPQVAEARAALASAGAAVEQARRNLGRTEIRAPYAGRVREKRVDVGQFVSRGTSLGTIYAVDFAEIRLPLPDAELAFVDLPLNYRGELAASRLPDVTLRADFAGRSYTWTGKIVRTEGEIDPQSRMVHTVARVKNPYARGADPDRPPLAAGLFVQAEIEGRSVPGVAVIPRSAVRSGNQVLIVDGDDRLRFRDIEVLRGVGDRIVVEGGLADGDRLCLSPLTAVTDGMRVMVDPTGDTVR